jgi:thiamine-phosphate pyrophosphorylase
MLMSNDPSKRLHGRYALTPDEADTAKLLRQVAAALDGGVRWLQYRNKRADAALRQRQARELQALCAIVGAQLIVNDFPELAADVDAAGAHVGKEDGALADARAALGEKIVGVSCYNESSRALAAQLAGADYVAFGSFFASPTKPNAVRASIDLLRTARAQLSISVVAIGGITLDNASSVIAAGADAVAVSAALFNASDIAATAQAFNRLFVSN